LVERVHDQQPDYAVKPIISVLDEVNLVTRQQLQFWDWLADYYCCTLGEVMAAALPGQLRLSSETKIVLNEAFGDDFNGFDNDEYLIGEALLIQQEITIEDARKILNKKTVFPVIQRLLNKGALFLREDLQEKFRPKKISAVRLAEPYQSQPDLLREVMGDLGKKERQLEVLMAYLALEKRQPYVRRQDVLTKADVAESSLNTLIKKGILEKYEREISRMKGYEDETNEADVLSEQQQRAISELQHIFTEKAQNVALLYGITGSGKTRVYIELIREIMRLGGQVLYLLPEIALTAQITHRLQRVFGSDLAVYHSKINHNERAEVWKSASAGKPLILAARSGLFLPFKDLRLIIVDEEHDASFKQYDPAPRYHARDAAIFLANIYSAKTLLGTATPSIETWHNVLTGKYGLVEMPERYGGIQLPEIQMIDLREMARGKQMQSIFSPLLLEKLKIAHRMNHFALKHKIYLKALKTAWQEIQALKCHTVNELYSPSF
jgi:primosomal protein N' (replication factor Y)